MHLIIHLFFLKNDADIEKSFYFFHFLLWLSLSEVIRQFSLKKMGYLWVFRLG